MRCVKSARDEERANQSVFSDDLRSSDQETKVLTSLIQTLIRESEALSRLTRFQRLSR